MEKLQSLGDFKKLNSQKQQQVGGGVYPSGITWKSVTFNQATVEGSCTDTYNLMNSDDGVYWADSCAMSC